MPSPFLGTFGAFIRVRSPIYSQARALRYRRSPVRWPALFSCCPALAIGLAFSKVIPGIAPSRQPCSSACPACEWLLEHAIFPGVRAADIYLHPVARAAWVGMFATAMNLLPIGQLDGGHILYSFFPQRHRTVSQVALHR